MGKAIQAVIPVFVFLLNDENEVYLQRRFQTGYLDGHYDCPAGKIDEGEFPSVAAVREAKEEAGITVDPENLEFFHSYMNLTDNKPWFGIFYRTRVWQGIPEIVEPHKCDEASFYSLDKLPNVIPQVRDALKVILTASTIQSSEYDHVNDQ